MEFTYYIDQKVTVWYRTKFTENADTRQLADKQAIEFVEKGGHEFLGWERIDDTVEVLSLLDNNGQSTEDLFYDGEDSEEEIWNNLNGIIEN